jgi:hypothetical protein
VEVRFKGTVPAGTIDCCVEEAAPEVQEATIFYRPYGTEVLALRFPALRTGLLSNVPPGPARRSEHQKILP